MRRFFLGAVSATVLLRPGLAAGCPLCSSEAGRRVRAGLFGADFGYNLFATALPFLVLLSVVALVAVAPPSPAGDRRPPPPEGPAARGGPGPDTFEADP